MCIILQCSTIKRKATAILAIFVFGISTSIEVCNACTIGVTSGRATSDGRPLIWKVRDRDTSKQNNAVVYNTSFKHKFISVVHKGSTAAWQGVNDHGFAIMNSLAKDISDEGPSGRRNGSFMRYALGNCITVADFEHLLRETNESGRRTRANFVVLDATGAAAIFEVSDCQYWKFDVNDPNIAPKGYLVRSNFAFNGSGKSRIEESYSVKRYKRADKLVEGLCSAGNLNYKSIVRKIMRDFSDDEGTPISVPFAGKARSYSPWGYIRCDKAICRSSSVSASVIVGVLPSESAKLSTMWTILGQPACSIATPYWPIGQTPAEANSSRTAPLCDIALKIRSLLFDYKSSKYLDSYKLRDGRDGGLWAMTFPAEDRIFEQADGKLSKWRRVGPNISEMMITQTKLAAEALSVLQKSYSKLTALELDGKKSADEAIPSIVKN